MSSGVSIFTEGIVKADSELNMENFYVYHIPLNWGTYNILDMYSFDMYGNKLYFASYHWTVLIVQ